MSPTVATRHESAVRGMLTAWVDAVAATDVDGVTASRADDVVLFDVAPPEDGVRGIEDDATAWRPFLEHVRGGCRLALVELHVEVGGDLAWAWALLRCGTDEELADHPGRRLRLSVGLRRGDAGWDVAHEHHSSTET